ncbi:MAG: sulfatase [Candidatus Brocadiae bacterium]|nr:sulfatase [Candidatus Brocadiia bacterium]
MAKHTRRTFMSSLACSGLGLVLPAAQGAGAGSKRPRPNVVMIVIDDLNDYITDMGGHPQAKTPHMAKLAASGVRFRRAYSNNPVCAPSRGSFFTGIYPHTSRLIHFGKWYENEVLINSKTLPEYFQANGYRTLGTGKLLHHWRPHVWGESGHRANYGPFAYDGKKFVGHPSVPEPFRSIGEVDGSFAPLSDVPSVPKSDDAPGHTGWIDVPNWKTRRPLRYVDENDRDLLPDERNALWAANKIRSLSRETEEKPFFLGVGFIRPHTPLYAPKRFFDMFPLKDIQLPVIQPNDAADTHYKDVFTMKQKGLRYFQLLKQSYPTLEKGLRVYVRAYLACVAFVDEQVGKVVDAVDHSPFRDNTIILLTSDHGYNLGQKDYLFKNSLWEESGRVPLMIRAPGVARAGAAVEHPVSLIDIYPTLADLCGLHGDTRKNAKGAPLDGHSLKPFLLDPQNGKWDGPDAALTVIKADKRPSEKIHQHHYAIRTRRWRYVLYNNGNEELYDHDKDPREWTDLAGDALYRKAKAELKAQLFQMTGRQTD